MKKIKVNWTGVYPCLCYGEWKIWVDGKDVSDFIPEDLRNSPMETYGTYNQWHFEDCIEVFEDYEDGLSFDEWIEENDTWISKFLDTVEEKYELYCLINEIDFRHGSCGGCI